MDASEMHELLRGYLGEMDWTNGATKEDIMRHLAGRDDALRTMVNEYVSEGTYQAPEAVLTLISEQAWEDASRAIPGEAPRANPRKTFPATFRMGP